MAKEVAANEAERIERAEEFLAAAREHYAALIELPDEPNHYPLAYYLAGLAVECMFRAYTELVGGVHDPNHNLQRHAELGKFLYFMPESEQSRIREDLSEIRIRWLNTHRYRSVAALRRYLTDAGLYRMDGKPIKGGSEQVVRRNWQVLYDSSAYLLNIGIEQWQNSKRKWNQ